MSAIRGHGRISLNWFELRDSPQGKKLSYLVTNAGRAPASRRKPSWSWRTMGDYQDMCELTGSWPYKRLGNQVRKSLYRRPPKHRGPHSDELPKYVNT
jgi:hypothetical protein